MWVLAAVRRPARAALVREALSDAQADDGGVASTVGPLMLARPHREGKLAGPV